MRTTTKSGGQPHFENVVVRWTTRLSALITNPVITLINDLIMQSVLNIMTMKGLILEGQHGAHEEQHDTQKGQHDTQKGQHGAHEGQHGAHKRQHGLLERAT